MVDIYIDCAGDSLTAGVVKPTWPQILRKRLNEELNLNAEVRNRGKHGMTVSEYTQFLNGPVTKKLMTIRQPDYVLVMLGANNTRSSVNTPPDQLKRDYHTLIVTFREVSPESVLLFGLLPPYYGPVKIKWEGDIHIFANSERIPNEINPMIAELAAGHHCPVVDCYTPMKAAGANQYIDGIHPNAAGHKILAGAWFDALKDHFSR